jgi:hypothetical protein
VPSTPYVTGVFEGVFAVRWRTFTLPALAELRRDIAQARLIVGRRLVYLCLIPSSPHDFPESERQVLGAFVRDLLVQDCESIHHVLDGVGFAASVRRSIVTALAVTSARPDAFHTYPSLEAAMTAIGAAIKQPAERLLDEARRRNLAFR